MILLAVSFIPVCSTVLIDWLLFFERHMNDLDDD